ncbi:peroxisomal carnitine O-octanoyltransferase isoform X1 [Polyodon spathula]|uniref:peroxisomal carnitine O-octanoyltransferase isoform X1 n=1 Tax=Polyodon spathula TaxID=7913 RepID=UPI001B7DDD22|nr:peroxisomal carnitine O-octanoyltransferase isoform X1 [Polyodon spathula]
MSLPNFPIPNLDTTLKEAGRVLELILPPEQFQRYQSALRRQEAELQEIHARFAAQVAGRENWATEDFKNRLLSCPDPIPTSTALPVLLQPSAAQGTPELEGGPQLARAAALLWAAAKIHSDPRLLEGDAALEQTQRSELFSACREPGETRDQIKVYPDSLHAVLLYRGSAFPLQLLSPSRDPLLLPQIHSQLLGAVRTPPRASLPLPASPCSLTALERPAWHAVREGLLSGEGAGSLRTLESAVLALALEECPPPDPRDPAAALTSIQLGSPKTRGMRHYDKVLHPGIEPSCSAVQCITVHCSAVYCSVVQCSVYTAVTRPLYRETLSLSSPLLSSPPSSPVSPLLSSLLSSPLRCSIWFSTLMARRVSCLNTPRWTAWWPGSWLRRCGASPRRNSKNNTPLWKLWPQPSSSPWTSPWKPRPAPAPAPPPPAPPALNTAPCPAPCLCWGGPGGCWTPRSPSHCSWG